MKSELDIAGLRVMPGEKARGFVDLAQGPAGTLVRAAIIAINGTAEGPTLLAVSGVHGDDLNTVPMIWRLAQELDPNQLSGQLLLVPVANPLAFEAGTHLTPADNAAPSFPGNPAGTISQRMAHSLFVHLAERANYVLDMHGGSRNATLACLAIVESSVDEATYAKSRAMAEAFHPEVIVIHEPSSGPAGLAQAANRSGIPGAYLGLGQMGFNEADTVRGVTGVKNILRYLRMLPGNVEPAAVQPAYTRKELYQRAAMGGAFEPAVRAGEAVTRGDVLGRLRNVFGQPVGEVLAETDGVVDAIRNNPVVAAGDWVASIAPWPIDGSATAPQEDA
jgi:uncharacterized protein